MCEEIPNKKKQPNKHLHCLIFHICIWSRNTFKIQAQKRVRVTAGFVNTHRHRARGRGDVNPDDHFNPKYSPHRQKTALGRRDRVFPVKRCEQQQPVCLVENTLLRSTAVFQMRHDRHGALVSPAAAVGGAPTERPVHRQVQDTESELLFRLSRLSE